MAKASVENPGGAIDPISQFITQRWFKLEVAGIDLSFTNANFMMVLGLTATFALVLGGLGRNAGLVPTRLQVIAEGSYTFIKSTLIGATGEKGKPFIRLMVTLFFFIAMGNFLGMVTVSIPGVGNFFHTYTAHVWVTFTLGFGLMIFVTALGLWKHGLRFFTLFAPSGVSPALLVVLVPIEFISYLTRPVTLGVRLFANMMAGHALLKTLASFPAFMYYFFGASLIAGLATFVFLTPLIVALTGLEFVIAFLQAYVFIMLGSIYFKDAIHLH